ncbi:MAG: hypothetical protein NC203_09830 [Firmicutes bacterium]|nr:hypothetical protein [[Eubacterium] siraeum]MCM1488650.1 hypothetical protein [Bacillota bacterium]
MKRILKIPVEFETALTEEELKGRIEEKIKEQQEENLYSQKGRELFLWENREDGFSLKYHHSFKNDMCDTAFYGSTKKGLKGCRLEGFIKKPPCIWAVFWVIIGVMLLIMAAFFIASLFADDPQPALIPIFGLVMVGVAFVEVNLLMFDKKRLRTINDHLREFTAAANTDVLGEELEDELEKRQELISEEANSAVDNDD